MSRLLQEAAGWGSREGIGKHGFANSRLLLLASAFAFSFLEFPSKIGHFSRELSSAHSENSEIDRLNCFFEFFAFKIQFPHTLTTYNAGTTL